MDASFVQSALESMVINHQFIVAQPISDLTTNQYNAMLAGFIYGVIDQNHLTEIELCLKDGKTEATDAYTVIKDFEAGQWTTGIKELGVIVKTLPTLMKDCTSIGADITSLETWASVFLDTPADIEALIKTNVTHSLIKLTRDLKQAKQDWAAEKYFAFGTELGDMLVIATQPLTPSTF